MADLTPKTIGELPAASALDGTELLALSQGGEAKKAALSALMSVLYPVGSIYLSVNSTSPATLFGGTWVQIKDTFLLAAGDTYSAGTTGGEAEHVLTRSELPAETYDLLYSDGRPYVWYTTNSGSGGAVQGLRVSTASDNTAHIGPLGSGTAHNNMPPYLAVYMWQRTA